MKMWKKLKSKLTEPPVDPMMLPYPHLVMVPVSSAQIELELANRNLDAMARYIKELTKHKKEINHAQFVSGIPVADEITSKRRYNVVEGERLLIDETALTLIIPEPEVHESIQPSQVQSQPEVLNRGVSLLLDGTVVEHGL